MISEFEKQLILEQAYVPEHSVELMQILSEKDPGLIEGFFFLHKRDHIILVGYPVGRAFRLVELENVITKLINEFNPVSISLISPELPKNTLLHNLEKDEYYTLQLVNHTTRARLVRLVQKARETAYFELDQRFTPQHEALVQEFMRRVTLPPRIKALYLRTGEFLAKSKDGYVLNAWDQKKRLIAFLVVDTAPKEFSIYVLGCYSKINYVPWASDMLFFHMIELSKAHGKNYIHLGLGVNDGIRQFKKKWGGVPELTYHSCDIQVKKPTIWETIYSFVKR